jgi:hypothetical protein
MSSTVENKPAEGISSLCFHDGSRGNEQGRRPMNYALGTQH